MLLLHSIFISLSLDFVAVLNVQIKPFSILQNDSLANGKVVLADDLNIDLLKQDDSSVTDFVTSIGMVPCGYQVDITK